ncbi:MAG: DUF2271 domain-containing protein [Cellulophaga sp.]
MKNIKNIGLSLFVALLIFTALAFNSVEKQGYKCIIQLTNYTGEGAYVVLSLIDAKGEYVETLYMLGEDEKWYDYFTTWWKFWEKDKVSLDAITGESIIGGDRKIIKLDVDTSKIDAGYKIRFETAVEDQDYFIDAEVDLNSSTIKNKITGEGYIRYIRFIPN